MAYRLKRTLQLPLSSTLAVALLLSLIQAPLAHRHPLDPEHHHATGLTHAHFRWALHDAGHSNASAHDDDAQTLDWVGLVQESARPPVALASESIRLPQPELVGVLGQTPAPCGHDPPPQVTSGSRAPPA